MATAKQTAEQKLESLRRRIRAEDERLARVSGAWPVLCGQLEEGGIEPPTQPETVAGMANRLRCAAGKHPGVIRPPNALTAADFGLDDDETPFDPTPAGEPCEDLPGTPGRIAALARRVELGQELWHPADNNGDEPADGVEEGAGFRVRETTGHRKGREGRM